MNKSNAMQSDQNLKFSSQAVYGKFSIVIIIFMLITLLPHYGKITSSTASVSAALVIHGIFYLGWHILFAVQSRLSSKKNVTLHKKLGYLSLLLISFLIYSGADLMIEIMKGFDSNWTPAFIRSRTSFVLAILHTLLSFICFCALGVVFRKKLHFHKRFMVLASLSMVAASVTRIAYLPIIPIGGVPFVLLITYGFLLAPVIIDRVTFGHVHPVLKWGVPVYLITQLLCIGVLPPTAIGQAVAFPF